jgi:hypothetical protein
VAEETGDAEAENRTQMAISYLAWLNSKFEIAGNWKLIIGFRRIPENGTWSRARFRGLLFSLAPPPPINRCRLAQQRVVPHFVPLVLRVRFHWSSIVRFGESFGIYRDSGNCVNIDQDFGCFLEE